MAHVLGKHRLFALGALHATNASAGNAPVSQSIAYVLIMAPAMLPLAIAFDWFAVKVAWIADDWLLRVTFTIPGLVCTALVIIGIVAWLWLITWCLIYVTQYALAWYRHSRSP